MEGSPGTCAQQVDDESDSGYGQSDGGNFLECELLLAAGDYVEQHPDGGRVLHDDGGGHVDALDGDVIKIVRNGDAQRAEKKAICEIARRQLDALPAF